jgi:hypothetical protein
LSRNRPSTPASIKCYCPAPNYRFALTRLPHDLNGTQTVLREQDDPGAPNMVLRAIPIGYDRFKSPAIARLEKIDGRPYKRTEAGAPKDADRREAAN